MTATSATGALTYSQHQVLKAIVRKEVYVALAKPGTWRQGEGRYSHVVTATMRVLITRGLVVADQTFTGARLTADGYAALSRAAAHPPAKKRS